MGVYGTTYKSAFSGLGKPSIKLEFEDNEALVAFSKKMKEGEPAPVEEEGMFTPVEGAQIGFDVMRFYKQNAAPFVYMPLNETNIIAQFGEPQEVTINGKIKKGYYISTPIGVVILPYVQFGKLHKDNRRLRCFGVVKSTISNPWIIKTYDWKNYIFQKSFNDNGNTLIFKCVISDFADIKDGVKSLYPAKSKKEKTGGYHLWINPQIEQNRVNPLAGFAGDTPYSVEFVEFPFAYITDVDKKSFVSIGENSLEGYGDFYTVRDMRKRSRKEPGDVATNKNLQFVKDAAKTITNFNHKFYLAAQAQQDRLGLFPNELEFDGKLYTKIALYDGKEGWYFYVDIFLPKKKNGKDILKGYTDKDRSFIDINKCINITPGGSSSFYAYTAEDYYKDLFSSVILSQYNILVARRKRYIEGNYDTSEIDKEIKYFIAYYSDPSKYQALHLQGYKIGHADYEAKKYTKPGIFDGVNADGLGKTANNTLYNNLEILDFRGMQPTYRQLPNYDAFFKPAVNKNSLKGWGLDDTKKLIADICRKHYKDCAAIARHLKAETKLQSAFNLWHWLHNNIRYEYDREGREEVRTPLRTWADRHRGVDCDCLSVFAYCVLKCMGYNPAFELVAFKNRPQFSHIFINLDGIVVDRVWFVFNSRPPLITSSQIYKIDLNNNLGNLF